MISSFLVVCPNKQSICSVLEASATRTKMGKIFSGKKAANMVVIIMVIAIVLALMAPSALGKAAARGGGFGRRGGSSGRRGGGGRLTNGHHARGHPRSSAVALDPGPAFGFLQLMPFVFSVFFLV
ncbi:hypothetical protein V6N12_070992 [Hibiscus sabdariffa]|uniref:Glycine-rich protein n=1 Tax=Hibiscus sabdariffa TaxID=183260 RepID=A0ABR2FII5_9ROSI